MQKFHLRIKISKHAVCKSLDWQMSVWQKSDGQKSFDKYEMAKVGLAKTGNHQDVDSAKLLKIAILAQNRRFGAKSPLVLTALLFDFVFFSPSGTQERIERRRNKSPTVLFY